MIRPDWAQFVKSYDGGLDFDDVGEKARALDRPIILGARRRQGLGTEHRLVIHHQTSAEAIDDLIALAKTLNDQLPATKRDPALEAQSAAFARGDATPMLGPTLPASTPVSSGYGR